MAEHLEGKSTSLLTVLVVDITDSTLLYAQRGDTVAFGLVWRCLETLETEVARAGGRVVKRMGDGIMAVFPRADDAVRSAVAIIDAVKTLHLGGDEAVSVRVGISTGSAMLADADVFGDVVNVAARLVSIAGAHEVFLSESSYEQLSAELRAVVRLIDQVALRNRPMRVRVYQFVPKPDEVTVLLSRHARVSCPTLEVTFRSSVFVLGPERPKLTIGRDAENDIVIDGQNTVSRYHANIHSRGDRFVLRDRSANGTYLRASDGTIGRILRDEVPLSDRGEILPGTEINEPIRYRVRV